jgi:DnaJ family protein C protein 28
MSGRDRAIEEIIRKAIEAGKFDNLSGKGKPLNLSEDAHGDPAWRLAHDMLKQRGFAPAWIELRQEIEREYGQAREMLARTWAWREETDEERGVIVEEWRRAQDRFHRKVAELNQKIKDYNASIPADVFYCPPIDAQQEIQKIMRGE